MLKDLGSFWNDAARTKLCFISHLRSFWGDPLQKCPPQQIIISLLLKVGILDARYGSCACWRIHGCVFVGPCETEQGPT
jgi:hypothetical protein